MNGIEIKLVSGLYPYRIETGKDGKVFCHIADKAGPTRKKLDPSGGCFLTVLLRGEVRYWYNSPARIPGIHISINPVNPSIMIHGEAV